ncbi:MAG: UDP-glucose/GDP-mannose dehydrogenase family protein [Candidatus Coatesbacteria bacterium]|nr:UDP-glucose/GDP-mannose dehydrogenase family protein [Candidatus Coatesbacteria bacterium]
MNICVVGVGYVGLVTGAVFADLGNDVICVDIDEKKVEDLKKGIMPIFEPGLKEIVVHNSKDGRLTFTTSIKEGVRKSEIIFIGVNTPPKDNGETDLSYVKAVAESIAECIDGYKIIVNKSTVPVGTGDLVREIIDSKKRKDVDFDVVSNPEFLREGSAIKDTLEPDRIVIGAPSKNVAMKLLELYAVLERPMIITDVHSAEIIKYASNAFLATKISFVNFIADLCELAGADVNHVVKGMGSDKRIGGLFLQPGLGYGGSCFPKDSSSLAHTVKTYGGDSSIIDAVMRINAQRAKRLLEKIEKRFSSKLEGKTFAMLGLAFKPNTDDIRDAKSLDLIKGLLKHKAIVKVYDPAAMGNVKEFFPDITYCQNAYEATEGADALILVTEWNEFRLLNFEKVRKVIKQPILFDGRNLYDPKRMHALGFEYHGMGVKSFEGSC